REVFQHEMRWARSTRDSRRMGYLGLLLTFGLPWAMISVATAVGTWWSWTVLAAAALLRAAVALEVGLGVVHDRAVWRHLWLLPLRDLVAFWVWFASFADHKVHWRGDIFILEDGKIRPPNPRRASLPRRSRSRTKFPLIGKHQLASPLCHLACRVLDVSRQSEVLRALVARSILCERVFCGEQKDRLLALPKPLE